MSIAKLLGRMELFSDLPSKDLEQLSAYAIHFDLEPGKTLFRRGDRTNAVFLIDRGRLEVVSSSLNGQHVVGHIGANEIAGEMALLSGEPRSATLRATEPTSGVAISKDVIDSLRRSPRLGGLEISRHLVDVACRRIRRRLAEFAEQNTPQRSAHPRTVGDEAPPDGLDHVASLPWFSVLGQALPDVVEAGRWWKVPRGAVIVDPGTDPTGILVPTRGAVEELLDAGERRYRVRLAGPGRMAAKLGVLDDGGSPVTVRSLERAIVFELPRDVLADSLRGEGRVTRALLNAITEDLAGAVAAANAPHPWELRA